MCESYDLHFRPLCLFLSVTFSLKLHQKARQSSRSSVSYDRQGIAYIFYSTRYEVFAYNNNIFSGNFCLSTSLKIPDVVYPEASADVKTTHQLSDSKIPLSMDFIGRCVPPSRKKKKLRYHMKRNAAIITIITTNRYLPRRRFLTPPK